MKKQKKNRKEEIPRETAEPQEIEAAAAEESEVEETKQKSSDSEKEVALTPEEELAAARAEVDQVKDKYLRLMAEFDNYKKRTRSEISNIIRSANESLILQLLEVIDNFERALGSEENTADIDSYKKGIQLIYEKLISTLKNNGLEPFDATGQKFNPELHDAMMQMPSKEIPENHVLQEIRKGYCLRNKVIRHSRVIVSKGKSESTEGDVEQKADSRIQEESTVETEPAENISKPEE